MANNVYFVDSAEVDPQESPALLFMQVYSVNINYGHMPSRTEVYI
jgi:hypothetical protein